MKNKGMVKAATILTRFFVESVVRVSKRKVVSRRGVVGGRKGDDGNGGGIGKRAVGHLLLPKKSLLLQKGILPNPTVG